MWLSSSSCSRSDSFSTWRSFPSLASGAASPCPPCLADGKNTERKARAVGEGGTVASAPPCSRSARSARPAVRSSGSRTPAPLCSAVHAVCTTLGPHQRDAECPTGASSLAALRGAEEKVDPVSDSYCRENRSSESRESRSALPTSWLRFPGNPALASGEKHAPLVLSPRLLDALLLRLWGLCVCLPSLDESLITALPVRVRLNSSWATGWRNVVPPCPKPSAADRRRASPE